MVMKTKAQILQLLGNPTKKQELAELIFSMQDELRKKNQESTTGTAEDLKISQSLTTEGFRKIPIEESRQIKELLEDVAELGAVFAVDGPLASGLANTTKELNLLLGDPRLGGKAFKSLVENLQGFGQMSRSGVLQAENFTEALGKQAAVLNQLGLNMGQFQQNVDTAVYSFGMSAKEVQKLNMDLVKLADTFDMLPGQVSRNFNLVAKNLAYDSEMIKEQFVKMQQLSLSTGVDVGTIQSRFGKGMDTISGASQAAASINALLGTNAVSATQLLMMPDAERAEFIRGLLKDDTALQASLSAGGAEGKFAMQTAAEVLGMDVDTARRFIDTGEREGAGEKSVKSQVGKQVGDQFSKASKPFVKGLGDLTGELQKFVRTIKSTQMDARQRFIVDERAIRLRQARARQGPAGQDAYEQIKAETLSDQNLGNLSDRSFRGGSDTVMKIMNMYPGRGQDFLEALQMKTIPESVARQVEQEINSGNPRGAIEIMNQSLMDVDTQGLARRYVQKVPKLTGQRDSDAQLTPTQQRMRFASVRQDPGATSAAVGPTLGRRQIVQPQGRPRIPERRSARTPLGSEVEQIITDKDLTINFHLDGKLIDSAKLKKGKSEIKRIDPND